MSRIDQILASEDYEARVDTLSREAAVAGDHTMVLLCDVALDMGGPHDDQAYESARRRCAEVLADAEAQS